MDKYAHAGPTPGTFTFADTVVDAGAHRLSRAGHEVAIEPKAFAVLLEFLAHPGQLRSRDQLLDAVWGHSFVTPATLNRIIAQLRRALDDDSEAPHCIQTVHGLGYRFIAPLEQAVGQAAPALRFAPPARARLPERSEPLIGRTHDVEALKLTLREHRLVTVVGPGGIGKTEAALECARQVGADFPDGVWWFDCTAQADAEALGRLLTSTFEIRTATDIDDLVTRLGELLRVRHALLVFDNCERIAEAVARVLAGLVGACVRLQAIVTTRRRLNCTGESLYLLPALELPPERDWSSPDEMAMLARVPAVQLLLTRSRAFASGFALTPENAGDVAALCRRLAGLPLALELAAARLRLLSPQQLRARMETRLLNLAEANPDRPAHHQNLRALIEWSFALLSERERALLCGISIFAGVCTFGGAAAIGNALGLDDSQTLEILGGLLDKSLLAMDGATNPPSYRLLDSVRLYAREQLAAGNHEESVRKAHLAHCVRFTEQVYAELLGERNAVWQERIKREWANLHAAFDFALGQPGLADDAVALVGNLCWYLRGSNDYAQSARWLERALQAGRAPTAHRARALIALGIVLHHSQAHDRAGPRLREGIALAMQQGEADLAAAGQALLAFELATCRDFSGAETCVQAALTLAEVQGDDGVRSLALLSRGVAQALNARHRDAEASMGAALDCAAARGERFQWAYVLINRALQRFLLGDLRGAAQDWLSDLDVFFTRFQHWRGAAGCVEGAAYLAVARGEHERATRFLAAAAGIRELTSAPLMPQWRAAQQVAERQARAALGAAFGRVQQLGATARFEDVVAEARAVLVEIAAAQATRTGASKPSGSKRARKADKRT